MPGVCLYYVCLLATAVRKTTEWIFTKFLPKKYAWTAKNLLNFGC